MNKDKKILKLINATSKASKIDLALFHTLIWLKYENDESFDQMVNDYYKELKNNQYLIALLCKTNK